MSKSRGRAPRPSPLHYPSPTTKPGAPCLDSETWLSGPAPSSKDYLSRQTRTTPKTHLSKSRGGAPRPSPLPTHHPPRNRVPQVSILRPGFLQLHSHYRITNPSDPVSPSEPVPSSPPSSLTQSPHHPPLPGLVVKVTRPPPPIVLPHQPSFHRILVHVPKLLRPLDLGEHVEVVLPSQPERLPHRPTRDRQLYRPGHRSQRPPTGSLISKWTCSGITTYPAT